jgi:hypothetical protein
MKTKQTQSHKRTVAELHPLEREFGRQLNELAKPKEIKITFSIAGDSFEGRLLVIASRHYTGGACVPESTCCNIVAEKVLAQWLLARVDFPPLPMAVAEYPLKRVEAELTKVD